MFLTKQKLINSPVSLPVGNSNHIDSVHNCKEEPYVCQVGHLCMQSLFPASMPVLKKGIQLVSGINYLGKGMMQKSSEFCLG